MTLNEDVFAGRYESGHNDRYVPSGRSHRLVVTGDGTGSSSGRLGERSFRRIRAMWSNRIIQVSLESD